MYKEIVSIVAEYLIYLLPIIAFGGWLMIGRREKYKVMWRGLLAVPLGFLIAFIAGELFYNPRPFVAGEVEAFFYHEADNGFPSTHMLAASLIAGITYFSSRWLGIILMLCAAAIGVCRVLAHVHSWVDIAASALVVIVAITVANLIIRKLSRKLLTFGLEAERL